MSPLFKDRVRQMSARPF